MCIALPSWKWPKVRAIRQVEGSDMKQCVSPDGHDWEPVSITSRVGSTAVVCVREGCEEQGYRIDNHVVAQSQGQANERLF